MIKRTTAYMMIKRGEKQSPLLEEMEALQIPPENNPAFNDSFYFTGHDEKGTWLITRMGFRGDGSNEFWFDLNIPGVGTLTSPPKKHERGSDITLGPLAYRCITPGKTWQITFDGPMILENKNVEVKAHLRFEKTTRIVNFKRDVDSWSIAGHMARQKWTRAWFEKLKELSQVHIEQGGRITGTVTVDGSEHPVALRALRDHTYGTRNWEAMVRHVWLAALMEDNSVINIALVNYSFLPFLHSGYVGLENTILPVTGTGDFSDVPAGDPTGKSFTLPFRYRGGGKHELEVEVFDKCTYGMGTGYTIYEGTARFSLNGKKGVGISEFGFYTK